MKRTLLSTVFAIISLTNFAQDMIVKKDGSIIQAKVAKIGIAEVEYKKWSNQDGPIYAIAKSDILAITYQNGEKEMFEDSRIPILSPNNKSIIIDTNTKGNIEALNVINNAPFFVNDSKLISQNKKAKTIGVQYGVTQNSLVQSDIISTKIEFCIKWGGRLSTGSHFQKYHEENNNIVFQGGPAVLVSLSNNSDQVVFVDLANTFLTIGGQNAEAYYKPEASSSSSTSSSGGSFNLGAITDGLGIGGIVGSIANGTTIGKNSGTTNSNVVFSQRVISIPPHSSIDLPYKSIYKEGFMGGFMNYYTNTFIHPSRKLCIGEELIYDESTSPFKLNIYSTISFEESFRESSNISVTLYCKKILGIKGGMYKADLNTLHISDSGIYSFGAYQQY